MKRVLESEVMADRESALAYAAADFSDVNQDFVASVLSLTDKNTPLEVLDLGCGPADIPILIAEQAPNYTITAIDASFSMIALARKAVRSAGMEKRIILSRRKIPGVELSKKYDVLVSNSLVHHLPDPAVFWSEVRRLGRRGSLVYVMDLLRPDSKDEARNIVEKYSGAESPILKQDFFNSLLAAFTLDEVKKQLFVAELSYLTLRQESDRHWAVWGRLNER